jgi:hypothetical protein
MRRFLLALFVLANVGFAARPVIFDTDMGNDIDDALALAMLHALTDRGECQLIGVTLTNASPAAVPYIRMLNRFYGRPALPVGAAIKTLKDGAQDGYMSAALRTMRADNSGTAEPAPTVLRRLLTNASEKVIIVQTGFSTNLAALLDSPGGAALAKDKVALVVAMAGNFADGAPEYNVKIDVDAAKAHADRFQRVRNWARASLSGQQHRARFRLRQSASSCGILSRVSEDALQSAHLGSDRRSRGGSSRA